MNSELKTLLILSAYIAPFLLLPTAFKFAGGAFASLTNGLNRNGRGLFDKQRKLRADKRQGMIHRAKEGQRFKGLGRGLNSSIEKSYKLPGAIGENITSPSRKNIKASLNASMTAGSIDASTAYRNTSTGQAIAANDNQDKAILQTHGSTDTAVIRNALLEIGNVTEAIPIMATDLKTRKQVQAKNKDGSLAYELNDDGSLKQRPKLDANGRQENIYANNEAGLDRQVAEVRKVTRDLGAHGAMVFAARALPYTGTGYDGNAPKFAEVINQVAGDDISLRGRLVAEGRAAAVQAGRIDQGGGGFGDTMAAIAKLRAADKGATITDELTGKQRRYSAQDATNDIADSAARSNGAAVLMSGKPTSAAAIGEAMARKLDRAIRSVSNATNPQSKDNALKDAYTMAQIQGQHEVAGTSAPANAAAFSDKTLARNYHQSDMAPEVWNMLTQFKGAGGGVQQASGPSIALNDAIKHVASINPYYNNIKHEYGSGSVAQDATRNAAAIADVGNAAKAAQDTAKAADDASKSSGSPFAG
jgi:hypothetical protein